MKWRLVPAVSHLHSEAARRESGNPEAVRAREVVGLGVWIEEWMDGGREGGKERMLDGWRDD